MTERETPPASADAPSRGANTLICRRERGCGLPLSDALNGIYEVFAAGVECPAILGFGIVDDGVECREQFLPLLGWSTCRHTPRGLNQIEIYFSIVQRKVLAPNDFLDLSDVQDRLTAFQDLYNLAARPFNWKYTKNSLNDLLQRLATHDVQQRPTAA